MAKTKFCEGLSDISDSYQAVIFDQWGVLHNGKKAYEGVVDCLKELRSRKKVIILMSNYAMREKDNKDMLKKMGIGPSLYDKIYTCGEFIASGLEEKNAKPFSDLGNKCYSFHSEGGHEFLKGSDIEYVEDVADAEFVLITGWDKLDKPAPEYEKILKTVVQKGLQTIFALPDSRALLSPNYIMGPGILVRKLKEYGGVVYSVGKPYRPIFQKCVEFLQEKEIFPGQTVMVGDTMAHDMMGAHMSEIDSCFVRSGIHAGAFRNVQGPADVDNQLNILIAQYNVRPTYLIESVQWGRVLPDRKHRRRLQPGERQKIRLRRRPLKSRKGKEKE